MASVSWDAEEQFEELNARKRHLDTSLAVSGSVLAVMNAVLLAEVLSVNEDTNTFLIVGFLGLVVSIMWLVVARRSAVQGALWANRAWNIEKEVLGIPERFSLWDGSSRDTTPAWVPVAVANGLFAFLWFGLMAYALYLTF